ncbi:MAG: MerC domain-containing protein [Bacteroidota bacterium]
MRNKSFFSDYLGIASAVLCLIHCLVGPVLMGVYNHAHHHHHHAAETSILLHHNWDYLFLGLGLIAVWFSAKHTHKIGMKVLLWLTYVMLGCSILLEGYSHIFQNLVYVFSIGLIVVHIFNIRHWLKHIKPVSV